VLCISAKSKSNIDMSRDGSLVSFIGHRLD
jgi:hypothetical protein